MKKRLAAMLLTIALAVGLLSLSACGGTDETPSPDGSETPKQSDTPQATEPPETAYIPEGNVLASGEAGESVTWSFYSDGTLVISGTGEMTHYPYYDLTSIPWHDYRSNINRVVIENGVTIIGVAAFAECNSLTSVTIPDSVTAIGKHAFRNCSSLASVTVPDSVTLIGIYAFFGTPWLESMGVFPVANGILLEYRGEGGVVIIPNGVTSIGICAFEQCSSLTSVTIPDGVTSIGDSAFAACHSLTSVTIPDSVTSIGEDAFGECFALTDVYYGGSEAQWNQIVISRGNGDLLNAAEYQGNRGNYEEPVPMNPVLSSPGPTP